MVFKFDLKLKIGNLKFNRRKLLSFVASLLVFVLAAGLTFKWLSSPTQAAWFDDSYAYRQKFSFTHNADISAERAVTFSLDTAELITDAVMQGDCDDTRFTDINGKVLKYQLTGTCNNAATTYEAVFLNIVNGTNYAYVYYGNPAAVSASEDVSAITALTPSGGDPAITTRTSEEKGTAPVAYWRFDDATGTNADDAIYNNDGTISGAAWQTEDQCVGGKCLWYDGVDDVTTVTNAQPVDLDGGLVGGFTISTWVRVNSDGENSVGEIFNKGTNTYLRITTEGADGLADLEAKLDLATTDATKSVTNGITLNKWHLVTVGYTDDGDDEITIYIDGTSQGSSTDGSGAPAADANNLLIGGGTAANFHGFIDEFKVFAAERSAATIKADVAARGSVEGIAASLGSNIQNLVSLSSGLVGYWTLNENSDGTSGAVSRADSSGIGTTLTDTSTTASASAKFDDGADFESTNSEYLSAVDNAYLSLQASLTIAAWIKPESVTASTSFDIAGKWDGANESYLLEQFGDEIRLSIDSASNYATTDAANLATGTFYHVAATYDSVSQTVRIFLNGAETASTVTGTIPASIGDDTGKFHIGAEDSTTTAANFYDGIVDDVRVYNRALSSKEVESLYNWAPGPVGYWKMDENTGTAVNDSSGNANNATNSNIASWWKPGKYGSSLEFDTAGNNRLNVGSGSSLDDLPALTVTAWIYATSQGEWDQSYIAGKIASNETLGWKFQYNGSAGSNEVKFTVDYNSTDLVRNTNSDALPLNTWTHIAVTWDGSSTATNIKFYANGAETAYGTTTNGSTTRQTDAAQSASIGGATVGGRDFDGLIDDVRIYNYVRSAKQVAEDMNAGHPAGGSPMSSQAVYWKFDEGQGTTANNSGTASSSNGTLTSIASPATATSGWTFTGKVNKGIIFDGSNDNVVIATANSAAVDFNGSEQFSGSAWVYVTTMPGSGEQDAIIAKWDDTGNLADYKLYVENDDADTTGNFEAQIYDESASQAITASQSNDSVAVNTWYHVAFTFNGGTAGAAGDLLLYVNGQQVASNAVNASFLGLEDKASDFTVGDYDAGDAVSTNTAFTGTIDEVKIYSGLLSNSEILVDMNAGSAAAMGGVLGTQDNEGFGGNPPVGWWKMDENTGTTSTYDSSGNGNTGTLTGGMTSDDWVPGKIGSGLDFDGSDDYVTVANSTVLEITGDVSFGAWVKADTIGNDESFIYMGKVEGSETEAGNELYVLRWSTAAGNDLLYRHESGVGTNTNITFDTNLSAGTWYHIMAVRNVTANSVTLYVNGTSYSGSYTTDPSGGTISDLDIGTETRTAFWDGIIDDVRVYDYALSAAQIAYIYNRGAPQAWYKFDECSGTTANNAAPAASGGDSGIDMTITIGATGSNTSAGTCSSGTSTEAWNNGTTGKRNYSLDFDGTDDYAAVTSSNLQITGDITVTAWINAATIANNEYIFAHSKDGEAQVENNLYSLRWNTASGNDLRYEHENGTGSNSENTFDTNLSASTWYHIAVARDVSANTVRLYVDGTARDSTYSYTNDPDGGTDGEFSVAVRNPSSVPTGFFDGQIDDFRVYTYELTADQVKRVFNGGAIFFGPTSGSP